MCEVSERCISPVAPLIDNHSIQNVKEDIAKIKASSNIALLAKLGVSEFCMVIYKKEDGVPWICIWCYGSESYYQYKASFQRRP